MRYGPELRGLRELAAENRDDLTFDVDASRGVASGIMSAIDQARPLTRNIYDRASSSLDEVQGDVEKYGGMTGLFADAATREQAGAERRVAESRAGALSDLASRKVQAEEGRAYAVNNAIAHYHEEDAKLDRQRQGLRGDMAAFRLGTEQQLEEDDRRVRMDERRIRLSERTERRQARKTQSDITGIDPATGLPTAGERDRRHDNRHQDRVEARTERRGGHTAGEIKDHRSIVGEIQDAAADARRGRKIGARWGEIREGLVRKRDDDRDSSTFNPIGGHGPVISKAAVELARYGHLSASTVRALRARGFLPGRMPSGWHRPAQHPGSLTPRNPDGTPG